MDINNILTLPESKTLEFKQDLSSFKPILKTIVGFANTAGGILIIGFSPEKGILGMFGFQNPMDHRRQILRGIALLRRGFCQIIFMRTSPLVRMMNAPN